jgi:hypothetical protein
VIVGDNRPLRTLSAGASSRDYVRNGDLSPTILIFRPRASALRQFASWVLRLGVPRCLPPVFASPLGHGISSTIYLFLNGERVPTPASGTGGLARTVP